MAPGQVILLNGTSSAGKTSIARALQAVLSAPYLHLSLDLFLGTFPPQYFAQQPAAEQLPTRAAEGLAILLGEEGADPRVAIRLGPAGQRLLSGLHHTIRALSLVGNNVIVDHVLFRREFVAECVDLLRDVPVCFVGVHCPPAILAERERERGDRIIGLAAWQYPLVHAGLPYDVEVDTSAHDPLACARQIAAVAARLPAPSAFERLRLGQSPPRPQRQFTAK